MTMSHPNADLIGKKDARSQLATPALLLEYSILEQNLAAAAELARKSGKALRPHFKAHKSPEIARWQLALGAIGLSVATVSEAEAVRDLGAELLLTSVVSTDAQFRRIARLRAAGTSITAVIDHPATIIALERALQQLDVILDVLIDLDMGRGRSGCRRPEDALYLHSVISASPNLRFRGLQAYAGQFSHLLSFKERAAAYLEFDERVTAFMTVLSGAWPPDAIVSGGSTGSLNLDLNGPLNELQCGSYSLMDVEYLNVESGWRDWPFKPALLVQSSVLSAHWPDHAIADAGDKWFASKYATLPRVVSDFSRITEFEPLSDEHAKIMADRGGNLKPGHRIESIPPHCDPTVNLFSVYHVFDRDRLVDIWPIAARGQ